MSTEEDQRLLYQRTRQFEKASQFFSKQPSAALYNLMKQVAAEEHDMDHKGRKSDHRPSLGSLFGTRLASNEERPSEMLMGRRMSSFLRNPSICLFAGEAFESIPKTVYIKRAWWKEAVVYQIYWRSFYDTSGDGYGDLQGVIEKLDYVRSLGVNIVWINPFYESPDFDNGYDISNYQKVMEKAGTLETFEQLVWEVHSRRMKIIIDLVVNHTSQMHDWFLESRSSRESSKRDWYIWRDARGRTADGKPIPPNNWRSYFNPSAWEWDAKTEQFYFHSFGTQQPDLNWANPSVRNAIYDMMRWWLNKGVDGFRMDAIVLLAKRELEDVENPVDIKYLGNNPGIHDYLQEMYDAVLKHYSIFTVGEIPFITPEEGVLYVGEDRNELNTLFHFQVCDMMDNMDLVQYKSIQAEWYYFMWGKGWNSQFLNNHDHTRQVSRYGNDGAFRIQSAKLLATMLHTLPGMPYIYQGEEIGMTAVNYDSIDDYNDIMMKNKYYELVQTSTTDTPEEIFEQLKPFSRDNSRSPMQWHCRDSNAGFTKAKQPWIKINPNYKEINVETAVNDKNSVFWYYRRLISLRKRHPVMVYGDYHDYDRRHPNVYIYRRSLVDEFWLIVLNHNDEALEYPVPKELVQRSREIVLANYPDADRDNVSTMFVLRPHEARIYVLMNEEARALPDSHGAAEGEIEEVIIPI